MNFFIGVVVILVDDVIGDNVIIVVLGVVDVFNFEDMVVVEQGIVDFVVFLVLLEVFILIM